MAGLKRSPWLGRTLSVQIERPAGAPASRYPVYRGVCQSEDGAKRTAYVLGLRASVPSFTGRVIGVLRREGEDADVFVLAPKGALYHQAQIAEALAYDEGRAALGVDALYRKACGAVVFRRRNGRIQYLLLLQRRARRWSVPKGHMEAGETQRQTAVREVREETGRSVRLIDGFMTSLEYALSGPVRKQVVLFLAKTEENPRVQREEIVDYRWATLEQARKLLGAGYASALERADRWLAANPSAERF